MLLRLVRALAALVAVVLLSFAFGLIGPAAEASPAQVGPPSVTAPERIAILAATSGYPAVLSVSDPLAATPTSVPAANACAAAFPDATTITIPVAPALTKAAIQAALAAQSDGSDITGQTGRLVVIGAPTDGQLTACLIPADALDPPSPSPSATTTMCYLAGIIVTLVATLILLLVRRHAHAQTLADADPSSLRADDHPADDTP